MMIRQTLKPTVILALVSLLFMSCGTGLTKALPEQYITDGELMVKSMQSAVKQLADSIKIEGVTIGTVTNLEDTSGYTSQMVFNRLEDVFAQVFSERGMMTGLETGGTEEKPITEPKTESEDKEGINNNPGSSTGEESVIPTGDITTGGEVKEITQGSYQLKYRLLTCVVEYDKAKNNMTERKATTVLHVRLEDSSTSELVWAGELRGIATDEVPNKYVKALVDKRYEQITPTKEKGGKNPFIEPLLVTAITGGLIYLFAVSARSK
jgi:hypothetical protein